MSYQIFYWIHIVSYLSWLGAFVASMLFAWKVGKTYLTDDEAGYMKLERRATSIGAHLGALGILISGGAMASMPGGPKWGWFNFEMYSWLGIKQVLFMIILVLVGFSIKSSITFKKKLRADDELEISQDTRNAWNSAYRMSLGVYILVVINTILGLFKPML